MKILCILPVLIFSTLSVAQTDQELVQDIISQSAGIFKNNVSYLHEATELVKKRDRKDGLTTESKNRLKEMADLISSQSSKINSMLNSCSKVSDLSTKRKMESGVEVLQKINEFYIEYLDFQSQVVANKIRDDFIYRTAVILSKSKIMQAYQSLVFVHFRSAKEEVGLPVNLDEFKIEKQKN